MPRLSGSPGKLSRARLTLPIYEARLTMRIPDIGGLIWESDQRFTTVAHALEAAELALASWIEETL
jgi:hypothetical protein